MSRSIRKGRFIPADGPLSHGTASADPQAPVAVSRTRSMGEFRSARDATSLSRGRIRWGSASVASPDANGALSFRSVAWTVTGAGSPGRHKDQSAVSMERCVADLHRPVGNAFGARFDSVHDLTARDATSCWPSCRLDASQVATARRPWTSSTTSPAQPDSTSRRCSCRRSTGFRTGASESERHRLALLHDYAEVRRARHPNRPHREKPHVRMDPCLRRGWRFLARRRFAAACRIGSHGCGLGNFEAP